jgi:hypothetical protein
LYCDDGYGSGWRCQYRCRAAMLAAGSEER